MELDEMYKVLDWLRDNENNHWAGGDISGVELLISIAENEPRNIEKFLEEQ